MELVSLKAKPARKRVKEFFESNIERMLYSSFIILFIVMIIIQAVLTSPAARTSLSVNYELEGKPLGTEEYLYSQGEIVLGLISKKTHENLKVLLNGEEIDSFKSTNVALTVKDGDVLEVDGSSVGNSIEVEVVKAGENIAPGIIGKRVIVNSEVKRIARVRIK